MSPVVEIGHPDIDIDMAAEADRIVAALEGAGLTVTAPLVHETGYIGLDAGGLDHEALQERVEQVLGEAFPAFVEMNSFYAKVVGPG